MPKPAIYTASIQHAIIDNQQFEKKNLKDRRQQSQRQKH